MTQLTVGSTMGKAVKCDSCGKFRKEKHIIGMWGEGNETWTECYYCCSEHDRLTYFKKLIKEKDQSEFDCKKYFKNFNEEDQEEL